MSKVYSLSGSHLCFFRHELPQRDHGALSTGLVFSEWDKIFKDPLTTAAAIDRVVHHSIIIEFGREIKSMRMEEAAKRSQQPLPPAQNVG